MSERQQLAQVCRWNRTLAYENRRLRRESAELRKANADISVERDVERIFLDAAWEAAQEAQRL